MSDFSLTLGWNSTGNIEGYDGPGWYLRATKSEGHLWALKPRRLPIAEAKNIVSLISEGLQPMEADELMWEFADSTEKYVESLRAKARQADALAAAARRAADELSAIEEEVSNGI